MSHQISSWLRQIWGFKSFKFQNLKVQRENSNTPNLRRDNGIGEMLLGIDFYSIGEWLTRHWGLTYAPLGIDSGAIGDWLKRSFDWLAPI